MDDRMTVGLVLMVSRSLYLICWQIIVSMQMPVEC